MKYRILRIWAIMIDLVLLVMVLAAPVQAQQTTEDREARRSERAASRQEYLKNHPEEAARGEERRAQREQYLKDHPEEAAKLEERRAQRKEFQKNNPDATGRAEGGPGSGRRGFGGQAGPGGPGGRRGFGGPDGPGDFGAPPADEAGANDSSAEGDLQP